MVKKKATYPHPRPVAVGMPVQAGMETPFAEGKGDGLDGNLRHRLISECAYARYCERGYADGYDLDDWLEAEAEVDHTVLHRATAAKALG